MSIRGPFYSPVADNDCFTKHEFMGVPWWKWMENLQHFESMRTRVLVNEMSLYEKVPIGPLTAAASFVFDRTPQCDALVVMAVFERQGPRNDVDWTSWRVDTNDVGGGNLSTGTQSDFSMSGYRGRFRRARWRDVVPVRYPTDEGTNPFRFFTDWQLHIPDSGATYPGTTMTVYTGGTSVIGNNRSIRLRGVCVMGARGT